MSEVSPPVRRDLAKYVVLAIGAALTAAIVAIVVWSARSGSAPADLRSRVAASQVISDVEIAVTVEVEKAPLASAECVVSAFNAKGTSVGRLTGVVFGPNTKNQRLTTLAVTVPTPIGRAASAGIATCRITRTR